jgi:hypothetical protein
MCMYTPFCEHLMRKMYGVGVWELRSMKQIVTIIVFCVWRFALSASNRQQPQLLLQDTVYH